MPYINIRTNKTVTAEQAEQIKSALGQAISLIPGKSENWLMVGIEGDRALWFQGKPDVAAMVSVSLYGEASDAALNALTAKITSLLHEELWIREDRIYVAYFSTPHWGWNGSNL